MKINKENLEILRQMKQNLVKKMTAFTPEEKYQIEKDTYYEEKRLAKYDRKRLLQLRKEPLGGRNNNH